MAISRVQIQKITRVAAEAAEVPEVPVLSERGRPNNSQQVDCSIQSFLMQAALPSIKKSNRSFPGIDT
ncbi:MAG: hypothetical protein JRF38_01690 [Deltaproteobacteria bacterium]|nr:hypothetical protein [Deltaproteobacteria bacterium]